MPGPGPDCPMPSARVQNSGMNLLTILDMAASGFGDRQALGLKGHGPTYGDLRRQASAGGRHVAKEAGAVVFIGQSGHAFVTSFFAANWADVPFIPLNYRLSTIQLRQIIERSKDSLIIAEPRYAADVANTGHQVITTEEWFEIIDGDEGDEGPVDLPERPALRLFTSGTTAEPKAAILEHHHLSAYIFGSVEFGAADQDDAALVSVPPYHIAGVANLLSNVFAGRRIIYLANFEPSAWLETVRNEGVTQAMVVPTMLARIVETLGDAPSANTPTLRTISYGGAHMPPSVLERALELFPGTGFVNAYGLTETSSTICVLGPDEHREAFESSDPVAHRRLSSVGRPIPGIEIEVRDPDGTPLGPEGHGSIWVRGEQVGGRYEGTESPCDAEGWFPTRDAGWLDEDGYLFVEGRTDDTIIRGGENIAPAEIEDVLLRHPRVADAAVVGLPDEEWGQRIAAIVVARPGESIAGEEITEWSRQHLRSIKAVDVVVFRETLPRTDTGKLIRREVLAELLALEE